MSGSLLSNLNKFMAKPDLSAETQTNSKVFNATPTSNVLALSGLQEVNSGGNSTVSTSGTGISNGNGNGNGSATAKSSNAFQEDASVSNAFQEGASVFQEDVSVSISNNNNKSSPSLKEKSISSSPHVTSSSSASFESSLSTTFLVEAGADIEYRSLEEFKEKEGESFF